MNVEPVEVARNGWGVIVNHERWHTLELRWLPTTRDMTDEGFKETLDLLAGAGERLRQPFMFIDATEFHHQLGEGVLAWRGGHISPPYKSPGVRQVRLLLARG